MRNACHGLGGGLAFACTFALAEGPFIDLQWPPDVQTSRSAEAVWIALASERYDGRLAEGAVVPGSVAVLHARCALGTAGSAAFPPYPPSGGLEVPRHPDAPGAWDVRNPITWTLDGLGHPATTRWPVTVRLAGHPDPVQTELVRPERSYSNSRPRVNAAIPGPVLLERLAHDERIEVEIHAKDIDIRATFTVHSRARDAARRMQRHCP